MDDGLKKDLAAAGPTGLELAPKSGKSQMVVSAIEGGPTSAPAPASRKPVTKPTPRPATKLASNRTQAPAPAPQPKIAEPVPSYPSPAAEPAPAPRQTEPAPLPPAAPQSQGRQKGVYKTEGDIFRQMPWIKP
ncbi:MAG: hypothetical protein JWM41_300 [Gemmatimonadetes bacterium]|nr:hypothetical protein [Gemmatimonadota bacterium]